MGDFARGEFFPKVLATFDFGFMLPWKHSSAWLYTSAGTGTGDAADSLRDFYFGAFGNNYVDDRAVKRYREYDSFPGFDIDAIGARSFVKSVAEWNLPPVRFADVGSPGLISQFGPAGAVCGCARLQSRLGRPRHDGDGGRPARLQFTVAVRLPMTFSIGYGKGFGNGSRHEILASLKIL